METQVHKTAAPEADAEKLERVLRMIRDHKGRDGCLIQVLHSAQEIFGYLPLHVQQLVAEELDVPLSEVSGVSSFYSFFTTKPKGEYTIRVCLGTACYVRGGQDIVKKLRQTLGIEIGETTPDGKFSLDVMRCIGACGLAPAITVNETVMRQVNPDKIGRILAMCD